MLSLKLSLTMAAAVAYALLTASVPASSGERVANRGPDTAQQRAQAFDGMKNDHNRFATKVDPPQEVEQTKMITK